MGGTVFPPCCLTWGQTMVEVRKVNATSFKRAPTLQQVTADPHLHQRLLDTYRQVWVSLLGSHCSFFLGPGMHKDFCVCFPESVSLVLCIFWQLYDGVIGRRCLLWPVHSLGKTLLAFALLHLYSKVKLAYYSRHLLTSYFCIPVPYDEKDISLFGVSSRRSCRSS